VSTDSSTKPTPVDLSTVRQLVDRAVRAAVVPAGIAERRARPESTYTWSEPTARAGFDATQAVIGLAEQIRAKYVIELRSEGASWQEIADLLKIEWSSEYVRAERAFDMVADPAPSRFDSPRVYWTCAGPLGCGQYVTDKGPYESYPADNEHGHAEGCRRLAAEIQAYEQEQTDRERRAEVMDEALARVTDSFGKETVARARYVQSHGGRYQGWSTSETLAVALVLRDDEQLSETGYSTRQEALRRILSGMSNPPGDPAGWLATVRAAATGLED
jgi:hypothetical protein